MEEEEEEEATTTTTRRVILIREASPASSLNWGSVGISHL